MSLTATFKPTGNSTPQSFGAVGGTDHHLLVSDGSDATYVAHTSNHVMTNIDELYTFDMSSLAGHTIDYITVNLRAGAPEASSGYFNVMALLKVGSVVYDNRGVHPATDNVPTSYSVPYSATSVLTTFMWNPATGKAWTAADLANLIAGFTEPGNASKLIICDVFEISITVTYEPCAQVTADTLTLQAQAQDATHTVESAIIRLHGSGILNSLRWIISSDAAGSSILADSGILTCTANEGDTLSYLQTWKPSVSGTVYLRLGIVCTDNATTYWITQILQLVIPTITACTVQQAGEYLQADVTVSDAGMVQGALFYAANDACDMEHLGGNHLRALIWVERGECPWTVVITTPWVTLSQGGICLIAYPVPTGITIAQEDQQLHLTKVSLQDAVLPDYATCSFSTSDPVNGGGVFIVKCHGQKWRMVARSVTRDDDTGVMNVELMDCGKNALGGIVTLTQPAMTTWTAGQKLNVPWAKDYSSLLSTLIPDIRWQDEGVLDILQQFLVLDDVTIFLHDGRLYVRDQEGTPVLYLDKGYQADYSGIFNHVREQYTLTNFPSPSALWNLALGSWTGTLELKTCVATTLLRPVSGVATWLHSTVAALTNPSLSLALADYDRFQMNWAPTTSGSMTVKLSQDASNYLTKTFNFGGSLATGWLVTGHGMNDVVSHTYSLAYTYYGIRLTFDSDCLVRARVQKSGSDVYTAEWVQAMAGQTITITLGLAAGDAVLVDVTQLHYLDSNVYGARCTDATLLTWQRVPNGSVVGQQLLWSGLMYLPPEGGARGSMPPLPDGAYPVVQYITIGDKNYYSLSQYRDVTMTTYTEQIIEVTVPETQPLYQAVDLALTDFVKTGNPLTITSITLTGTGDDYYDSIHFVNTRGTVKQADAYADGWKAASDHMLIRKGDQWKSAAVAQAFASKLLAIVSQPVVQYCQTFPADAPIALGDPVLTPNGELIVSHIAYSDSGLKTVTAGEKTRNTLTWMQDMAQRVAALERQT